MCPKLVPLVVNYMSLKSLLDKIQDELKKREEIREVVNNDMRKATRLSKQSILLTHQKRFDDARKLLKEASKLFAKLRKVSKSHPDLVYSGIVNAAFEEYTEANTLLGLVEKNQFVSPEELGVPSISYVLGLVDVIGELRRDALDSLRKGDLKTAENYLQMMEHIYVELTAMDDTYFLVPGLRRKCDIVRRVIEATRGDVTIDARRTSLESAIQRLTKVVERKRKSEKS